MKTNPASSSVTVHRLTRREGGFWKCTEVPDEVAAEAPLTLRVEGRAIAVIMRTPGHDRELAAGFLLTEGVIQNAVDVFEISTCPSINECGDSVDVLLTKSAWFDPDKLTRHVFTSSSCGICSKTDLTTTIPPDQILTPSLEPLFTVEEIAQLPEKLRAAQPTFASTGGLHACAWWPAPADHQPSNSGQRREETIPAKLNVAESNMAEPAPPALLFEDVGRHNALDKLLGHAFLSGQLPLEDGILMLSGRISFELVQKAQAARIPVIAAVGAPSSLAVDFANAAGITLCGFVRENRLNIYTHPERISKV